MFSRKRTDTEDRAMAELPDDLGIPMKPARPPGQPATVAPLSRNAAPVPPRHARRGAPCRRGCGASGRCAPACARAGRRAGAVGCRAAAQRNRCAHADRRPRDLALGRDQLVQQAGRRGQRRSQSAELPRCRHLRDGAVQGLRFDRRGRGARPLRRQSDGPQAAPDPRDRPGHRHDPLRSDRDRMRRPDLGRHPGAAARRAQTAAVPAAPAAD